MKFILSSIFLNWITKHSTWLLTILLMMSIWAIISIELEIFLVDCDKSEKFIKGVNRIFLGLSYSYVVGIIVFCFTVVWPTYYEKYRLRPVINRKIEKIGIKLEYMMIGFPVSQEQSSVDIKDVTACRELLKKADWNQKNCIWIYPQGRNLLYQTFFDEFKAIQSYITKFLLQYKSQIDVEQILYLETFNNAEFMTPLNILVDAHATFPPDGADFIIDEFVSILENYNKLMNTLKE